MTGRQITLRRNLLLYAKLLALDLRVYLGHGNDESHKMLFGGHQFVPDCVMLVTSFVMKTIVMTSLFA